jgi:hypothetical protein
LRKIYLCVNYGPNGFIKSVQKSNSIVEVRRVEQIPLTVAEINRKSAIENQGMGGLSSLNGPNGLSSQNGPNGHGLQNSLSVGQFEPAGGRPMAQSLSSIMKQSIHQQLNSGLATSVKPPPFMSSADKVPTSSMSKSAVL